MSRTSPSARTGDSMWAQVVQKWTRFMEVQNLSPKTIRQYRRSVVNFYADTLVDPLSATEDDIIAYLVEMNPQGSGRSMTLRALRSFYSFAEDREMSVNPARRLKPKEKKYGPAPYLTEDELVRLVIAAAWKEERRAWAILFLYATGARITSACAVTREDARLDMGCVTFRVSKGDKPYSVPLGPVGIAAIQGLSAGLSPARDPSCSSAALGAPAARPEGARSSVSLGLHANTALIGVCPERVRQWLREAADDAGLPRVFPHLIRHSAATSLYRKTRDPMLVKTFLNHSSLALIPRYVGSDDEALRAAMI